MGRVPGGIHHSGDNARLESVELNSRQRPDNSSVQEGSGPGGGVGCDRSRAGVHPAQHSKHSEHKQRVHTWQVPRHHSEPSEHGTRETGGGAEGGQDNQDMGQAPGQDNPGIVSGLSHAPVQTISKAVTKLI